MIVMKFVSRFILTATIFYCTLQSRYLQTSLYVFLLHMSFLVYALIQDDLQLYRPMRVVVITSFSLFYTQRLLCIILSSSEHHHHLFYDTTSIALLGVAVLWPNPGNRVTAVNLHEAPPKRYPNIDPIFGTDSFFRAIKNIKNHTTIFTIAENYKTLGDTYTGIFLGEQIVNTIDPRNLRTVYGGDVREQNLIWGVAPMRLRGMHPLCGSGIITQDGQPWLESRKMIRPALSKAHIEDFEGNGFRRLVDQWLASIPTNGENTDLTERIDDLFLNAAGLFTLGTIFTDTELREHSDKISDESTDTITPKQFFQSLQLAEGWAAIRMIFGGLGCLLSNLIPSWRKSTQIVHKFFDYHITRAAYEPSPSDQNTLIYHLTKSTPPHKPSNPETFINQNTHIRDTAIQAFIGTQDTTSTLINNTIFLLARHPDIYSALRAEALGVQTPITARSLHDSTLIANIINESLRLYPPVAALHRHALKDTTLPHGAGHDLKSPIYIPAGTRVSTSTYSLHRREDIFGPKPEEFHPERWNSIHPKAGEFMPFAYGPRSCIGKEMAWNEAAYTLVRLARRFERLESGDSRPWMGKIGLMVRNANGCWVRLKGISKVSEHE